MGTIKSLQVHVHSMNKHLTYAYLESLLLYELLAMAHPADRPRWEK